MGLSSNARLLSITARLTSNEYESQRISNAKMRLATQSQEASRNYINALNTQKLVFMTYDAKGNPINTDLTAGFLYQYNCQKNQYLVVNSAGQALIKSEDEQKFVKANNLDEFLESYGVTKSYKNDNLTRAKAMMDNYQSAKSNWDAIIKQYAEKFYENVEVNTGKIASPECQPEEDNDDYTEAIDPESNIIYRTYNSLSAQDAWEAEQIGAENDYIFAYNDYVKLISQAGPGEGESTEIYERKVAEAYELQANLDAARVNYATFDAWLEMKAKADHPAEFANYEKYKDAAAAFVAETEKFTSINESYEFSDTSKAQWYTNLWYRLNGESSEKSAIGKNGVNYAVLDSNLLTSSSWIQDALTQGIVVLENASYISTPNIIPDLTQPDKFNLKGITWRSQAFGSSVDIVSEDDEAAIAKAQAEYEAKSAEIAAKDKKFQNKITALETEHQALTKEYDSVQSALSANIKRSYKTFENA